MQTDVFHSKPVVGYLSIKKKSPLLFINLTCTVLTQKRESGNENPESDLTLSLFPCNSPCFHGRCFSIHINGDQVGHKHRIPALCHLVIAVLVRVQRQELSCQWMGISWVTVLGCLLCPLNC